MKNFGSLFTLYFIFQIKLCSSLPVDPISDAITFTLDFFILVIPTAFHIYAHIRRLLKSNETSDNDDENVWNEGISYSRSEASCFNRHISHYNWTVCVALFPITVFVFGGASFTIIDTICVTFLNLSF